MTRWSRYFQHNERSSGGIFVTLHLLWVVSASWLQNSKFTATNIEGQTVVGIGTRAIQKCTPARPRAPRPAALRAARRQNRARATAAPRPRAHNVESGQMARSSDLGSGMVAQIWLNLALRAIGGCRDE